HGYVLKAEGVNQCIIRLFQQPLRFFEPLAEGGVAWLRRFHSRHYVVELLCLFLRIEGVILDRPTLRVMRDFDRPFTIYLFRWVYLAHACRASCGASLISCAIFLHVSRSPS